MIPSGEAVHGEVHSSDASAGVDVALYSIGGVARTLASDERLVITDYHIVSAAGGDTYIVAGSAAAGNYIARGTVAVNGGLLASLTSPRWLGEGVTVKAFAQSGVMDCIIHGIIVKV